VHLSLTEKKNRSPNAEVQFRTIPFTNPDGAKKLIIFTRLVRIHSLFSRMKKHFLILLALPFLLFAQKGKAQSEVTFYTNMGTFVAEMYDTLQPITAGNFLSLVGDEFYDGLIFHRVIAGFMIQGGCPFGTGYGGPGYSIMDEFDPATSNIASAIAMANSGPNTGGSQFFINLVNNLYLNPNYPVFGRVTSNFSVVQAIGLVPTNSADRPDSPVVMDSVRITSLFTSVDYFSAETPLIEIYPNPVTENSVFKIKTKSSNPGTISIYDQMGTTIFEKPVALNGATVELDAMDIANLHLAAGIYYFVVTDGTAMGQRRFVVLE
jgi:cyclophilin family peptidyl-prolyl cis-trans isomerase